MPPQKTWTLEDADQLYNMQGWGLNYFSINAKGHVTVQPKKIPEGAIDVMDVIEDLTARGIKMPVLIRFQDILRRRVALINEAFGAAIKEYGYGGRYFGVYPIKVNQLREVVDEIGDAGRPFQFGLEAGSKGELLAVLAMNSSDALTIVNGYKDESMMRLAVLGLRIGRKVLVVIEKLSELELLLNAAREGGVKPLIGLRVKLQTQGSGKWRSSSGHFAKFGLTTPEILGVVEMLKAEGLSDCLKLVHFHIGSQISDIRTIKDAVKEGARYYAKLRRMGLGVEYLDCGGGLGVDYDGTHTAVDSSMNYSLREYVSDVVYCVQEVCKQEKVPEPNLVTESGRSLVAHHALLVVNVFGAIETGTSPVILRESPDEHQVVRELREAVKGLSPKNLAESFHDGQQHLEEAFTLFKLGYLGLEDKAKVENLYWKLCLEIGKLLPKAKFVSEDLLEMQKSLNDQYLCNFSIFQSLPDSWAIGQIFPIMPLHRLHEEPLRRASVVDITCDSDGKITQFATHRRAGGTLPVHPLDGRPYYLGFFLMGAYQATMGDIHNLFGRVNEVHIFRDEDEPKGYYIEETIQGQSIRQILSEIQYSDYELVKMIKEAADSQVKAGALKPREAAEIVDRYEAVLSEYTYVDHLPSADENKGAPSRGAQPAAPGGKPSEAVAP
ncbi:MAG TPA: arginine decarboxylase [Elusimicrobia bacterium]|nr:MAG: arginine decarboxylase [Elusimicrobia bacterium GWA2_66_18]OGR73003.1 MAG: arginine decarboxylase [Elusimicrobia bacterium GWC2_65_9]HAZ08165.1 arginine decarboxylase [Elusimicrobiota bacterium]